MISGRHILSAATLHYTAFSSFKNVGLCFKSVCDDLFGFWGGLWWFVMWFVVFCGGLWCFVVVCGV